MLYTTCYVITLAVGYGVIVWSEWKISKFFKLLGDTMSDGTRQMHAEVHKALIALVWQRCSSTAIGSSFRLLRHCSPA